MEISLALCKGTDDLLKQPVQVEPWWFLCSKHERVEKAAKLMVIADDIALMWRHCNGQSWSVKRKSRELEM